MNSNNFDARKVSNEEDGDQKRVRLMRLREAPSAKRRSADSKVFRADRIVKIGGDASGWVKGHRLYSRIDALQKIEGVEAGVGKHVLASD